MKLPTMRWSVCVAHGSNSCLCIVRYRSNTCTKSDMKEYLAMIVWLISLTQKVTCIKCTECDYLPHTPISGFRTCPENCYGEICFIVVNNHYNETLVSGCINVDAETRTFFRDHAYCYQDRQYSICGCTTSDRCNSPQAPLSMFTFINTPFFEDCQFLPKHDDQFFNSIQCNATLKEDNFESTKLPLKAESMEGAKSDEMTTENERIRDMPSVITKMTTSHSMITSYSTESIKPSSDKSGHYGSMFSL
ncbi:unnamed protein product [Onchocerca flexuosa]|uniref:Protein sleepless n=1 Tax=Onchocerca flexuosa TaxID=387005 RepID=A0A183GZF1_9BILA|nr:unnamed protein product [Onchocerca flexuosa]